MRAKSSTMVQRNNIVTRSTNERPNTSNFMYRPIQYGFATIKDKNIKDLTNSDIVYASSCPYRPSTTTFSTRKSDKCTR